jgi:hypothetical protein
MLLHGCSAGKLVFLQGVPLLSFHNHKHVFLPVLGTPLVSLLRALQTHTFTCRSHSAITPCYLLSYRHAFQPAAVIVCRPPPLFTAHPVEQPAPPARCPAGMSFNLPLSLFLDLARSLRRRSKYLARLIARSSSVRRRLTYEPYQPLYTPLLQFDADDDEVCSSALQLAWMSERHQLWLANCMWSTVPWYASNHQRSWHCITRCVTSALVACCCACPQCHCSPCGTTC